MPTSRGRAPITDEQALRAVRQHADGQSLRTIAERAGQSYAWVQRRVERGRALLAAGVEIPASVAGVELGGHLDALAVEQLVGPAPVATAPGPSCRGCGEPTRNRRHVEDGSPLCPVRP